MTHEEYLKEKEKWKEFYLSEKENWRTQLATSEIRTKNKMREDSQRLKDCLFVVASELATKQSFNDIQIENLRHYMSAVYDEMTKLGLMSEGELRYRHN